MLSIRNAVWDAGRGVRHLDDLSLDVHQGEILGIAGVEGNGQRPLGDLLSSLVTLTSGDVVVDGKKVDSARPGAMARAGVAVVPEDRHDSGIVLNMSVAENLLLGDTERVARQGIISSTQMTAHANELIEQFEIQCSGPDALYGPFREETNSGSSLREKCGGIQRCSSLHSRRGDLMSERSST